MVKLVGAVLVWSGCTVWGIRCAMDLSRHTRLLEQLVRSLEQLERELVFSHMELSELLQRVAGSTSGHAAQLFGTCCQLLGQELGFEQAWARALGETELTSEERECLLVQGVQLGCFDAGGQGQSVERVRRELECRAAHARERQQTLGRVYCMLGAAAGSFLALMLL